MHVVLRVRVTRVDSTLGCLSPQVISSLGYALAMHYPLCRRTKYDSQRREFRVPQRYQNEDFEFFQHHNYSKIMTTSSFTEPIDGIGVPFAVRYTISCLRIMSGITNCNTTAFLIGVLTRFPVSKKTRVPMASLPLTDKVPGKMDESNGLGSLVHQAYLYYAFIVGDDQ